METFDSKSIVFAAASTGAAIGASAASKRNDGVELDGGAALADDSSDVVAGAAMAPDADDSVVDEANTLWAAA